MTTSTEDMERLQRRKGRKGVWIALAVIIVAGALLGIAVWQGWLFGQSAKEKVTILGAGATFPCPLITKWSREYVNVTRGQPTGPEVTINYNCVGSGAGVTQITQKTVDFAGTDRALNASQRAAAPGLLTIPETLGSVAAIYNLGGIGTGLNLSGHLLGEIYLGKIITWNHPNITSLNPGVTLPSSSITVVHRSDSSGTTFVWTSYLRLSNPDWGSSRVGTSITWPVGVGASGNAGVAGSVQTTPGSIGYVEVAFAIQNSLAYAKVRNPAGNWILPSLESTAAAAAGFTNPPAPDGDWRNVSILNAAGATAYPIASLTYLLVYKELNVFGNAMTLTRARALVDFLWWAVHDGQDFSEGQTYPKLPSALVTLNEGAVRSITYNGQQLHS